MIIHSFMLDVRIFIFIIISKTVDVLFLTTQSLQFITPIKKKERKLVASTPNNDFS